jgi:hypothetical protein
VPFGLEERDGVDECGLGLGRPSRASKYLGEAEALPAAGLEVVGLVRERERFPGERDGRLELSATREQLRARLLDCQVRQPVVCPGRLFAQAEKSLSLLLALVLPAEDLGQPRGAAEAAAPRSPIQ